MSKDTPQRGFCGSLSFSIQKHTQQDVPKIALCHAQSINSLCVNFGLQILPHLNTLSKQENVNVITIYHIEYDKKMAHITLKSDKRF